MRCTMTRRLIDLSGLTKFQFKFLKHFDTFSFRFFSFLIDSAAYEEEILERIVIPLFFNIHLENETSVRTSVGELLLDFVSHCDTKRSLELLDVVEKLLNRSFDTFTDEGKTIFKNKNELAHITTMVDELIRVSNCIIIKINTKH